MVKGKVRRENKRKRRELSKGRGTATNILEILQKVGDSFPFAVGKYRLVKAIAGAP